MHSWIKVEIYYDVVSPYTWLAFETLCRYRTHWKMNLIFRPFFLGGVMNMSGNRPPMTVPAKGVYMKKDLERNAAYFHIPLKMMENPVETLAVKGTLRAQRFLTAISLHYPKHLEEVSRQLWMRIWAREEDIAENESLFQAAISAKMEENDIEKCLQLIDDPNVKEALKKTTEEAVEYGAFGAPTIIVHTKSGPELFFGCDRFPLIAMALNEQWKGPLPGVVSKL
nr:GSTkappa1 protein [Diaphanosoma celebensis]